MLLQELERSWEPWRQLDAMANALWRTQAAQAYPALNAWTNDHEAVVTAEIPGVDPNTLDIQVLGDTLTLRGSRTDEALPQEATVLKQERMAGEFSRSLQLPFHIEIDKVSAQVKNGVLTITLPRAEAEKPRKIALKAS